jgi:hypothetical protein
MTGAANSAKAVHPNSIFMTLVPFLIAVFDPCAGIFKQFHRRTYRRDEQAGYPLFNLLIIISASDFTFQIKKSVTWKRAPLLP